MKKIGSIFLVVSLIAFGIALASCSGGTAPPSGPGGEPGDGSTSGGAPPSGGSPSGPDGAPVSGTPSEDGGEGTEGGGPTMTDGGVSAPLSCPPGFSVEAVEGGQPICMGVREGGSEGTEGGTGGGAIQGPPSFFYVGSITLPSGADGQNPEDLVEDGIKVEFIWVEPPIPGRGPAALDFTSINNNTVRLSRSGVPIPLNFISTTGRTFEFVALPTTQPVDCALYSFDILGGQNGVHVIQNVNGADTVYNLSLGPDDLSTTGFDSIGQPFRTGRADGASCP